MNRWIPLLKPLLNVLLESPCPLCQRSTAKDFCPDCQRQVQRCQLSHPQELWQAPLPVFAWGGYGGALKQAIAALKYNNTPHLAQPLGHWLAQSWLKSPLAIKPITVVPIPMHPEKKKQRGFNQAELLAEAFCDVTRLPLQRQGLERVRATQAQFTLSMAEREHNLMEAFGLGKSFRRQPPSTAVLLLDDIYTTGATARSAAQVLRTQSISVYGLAAIAKTIQR